MPCFQTSAPVIGASYSDSGRSADSPTVSKTTAGTPPSCDPFFSSNYVHVDFEGYTGEYRANAACLNCWTYTRGGGDYNGLYSVFEYAALVRTSAGNYRVGVCQ